jgi:hypothetical protein
MDAAECSAGCVLNASPQILKPRYTALHKLRTIIDSVTEITAGSLSRFGCEKEHDAGSHAGADHETCKPIESHDVSFHELEKHLRCHIPLWDIAMYVPKPLSRRNAAPEKAEE